MGLNEINKYFFIYKTKRINLNKNQNILIIQ